MLTFFPGQTWCTLVVGGPDGLLRKQDGMVDGSLIGLHVAEEEQPFEELWAWCCC